jgi:hypothetical protein
METIVPDPNLLHAARIARGLDLAHISAVTALRPNVVRKLDEGRFHELPGGLYARSYVRAFAGAVGLSPAETLEALELLLPSAPDPIPILNELAPPSPFESFKAFLTEQTRSVSGIRLSLGNVAAILIDAAVLMSIGAALVTIAAWSCGVTRLVLLEQANVELAILFSVPVMLYMVIFERLAGRTPGQAICSGRLDAVKIRVAIPHRLPAPHVRKLWLGLRPARR